MKTIKRPPLFFIEIILWFLFAEPLVWVAILGIPLLIMRPLILFLAVLVYMFGFFSALITGIYLGFKYRSKPIPKDKNIRSAQGAKAGALSCMIFLCLSYGLHSAA